MVTQGLWQRDPVLMQLPHFSRELAAACADKGGCRTPGQGAMGGEGDEVRAGLQTENSSRALQRTGVSRPP